MRRDLIRRRSSRSVGAVALVVTAALLAGSASPSAAGFDASKAYGRGRGGCPSSDQGFYYQPYGQVYMQEYGKSRVVRFKAQFQLVYLGVTAGLWGDVYRRKTYTSATFPNDSKNYWDYLPYGVWHEWENIVATSDYRLQAKLTWDRKNRRDWNSTVLIANCTGATPGG